MPRVAEIHVFGWRDAYREIISDDYLFNTMLVSKRMKYFEEAVVNNSEESYVFDDGILRAFMTIGACRDTDKPDSFELWGIYVDPFMQKHGIGSKMVGYCETKASERGFSEIYLWVLEKNVKAITFYEKLGYVPDGSAKTSDHLPVSELRYVKHLYQQSST
ncbi:MAG: GNAT family N-acetyltransferase [Clostridiales bacterium]|nr:GNAT family N-acetyltransferase [Clostridiales bacterium]